MNYKNARLLEYGGMILGFLICVISAGANFNAGLVVGGAVWIGGVFLAAHFYTCPYCGEKLHLRTPNPDFCPHCGKKIPW